MKKVLSLLLALMLVFSVTTVAFNAYNVVDEDAPTIADALAADEYDGSLAKIYFLMPNGKNGPVATEDTYVHHDEELDDDGAVIAEAYDELVIHKGDKAPSWYNEFNQAADGKHYAGIYWWDSTAAPLAWPGYKMEIDDYDNCVYYAEIPGDDEITTAIFNNGVDGGTDKTLPIYYEAAQSIDNNMEGAYEGDYETLMGDTYNEFDFDGCIYVIDPDQVSINPLSGKQTCGGNWYFYYGNGCYGNYRTDDEENFVSAEDNCLNPDHFDEGGNHVGFQGWGEDPTEAPTEAPHTHTPAEPVQENVVPASCTAAGSYDEVVYCSECGEEISRTAKTIEKLAHTLTAVPEVPATTEAEGVKAHYTCSVCEKLFSDAAGAKEVTAADLVIPKLTPSEFTPDPNKLYFDTNGTGWTMGTKNKVAFHIFGGDFGTEANPSTVIDWGGKKAIGTATSGESGVFEIDPAKKLGLTLTPGVQYKIIFARTEGNNWTDQTYDLLFTTDCFGHIAFSDGTVYENPVDSSKKTLAAFWKNMDAAKYGPVLQVSSIGNVVGTCPEAGKTPASIFADFLTVVNDKTEKTGLENAREFVVNVGTKTEQKLIDDIGAGLGLTKQEVYDAFTENEIETVWDHTVSTLPGEVVIPHTHTPAEPVRENEKPAACETAGSYDEVVYCSDCGEEISRETKTIKALGHNLQFVPQVDATYDATGVKAHYECSRCHKLFSDATGAVEVTVASLVIPKLEKPTEPPTPGETYLLGDADDSGEVDISDATYIQRVDVGIINADAAAVKRGDVDGSGDLDVSDATWIQRYEVGLSVPYQIGETVKG